MYNKKSNSLFAIIFLIVPILCFSAVYQEVNGGVNQNQPNIQLIVTFKEGVELTSGVKREVTVTTTELKELIESLGGLKVKRVTQEYNKKGIKRKIQSSIFMINFNRDSSDMQPVIQALQSSGYFEMIEQDRVMKGSGICIPGFGCTTLTPNDTYYEDNQWAFENDGSFNGNNAMLDADIDMEGAWHITTGSEDITVAIIDTGIKLDHPEFDGRIVDGYDFINEDNDPTDDHGHGTNVAGLLAAAGNNNSMYAGVNWNCKIMPLKALDNSLNGGYGDMVSAIYYAVDNGADVISMSLGGTDTWTPLEAAIDYAYNEGVVVVASMMNFNSNTPYYPAAYEHVIAVGATDEYNERADPFHWGGGSSYGSHIDLVAPGNRMYSVRYDNDTGPSMYSGTSQSTPLVAGVVSLMLGLDTLLTVDEIETILANTSHDQVGDGYDTAGWDQYYGNGLLNAPDALEAVMDTVLEVTARAPYEFGELTITDLDLGHYVQTFMNQAGADSIVLLKLYVDETYGRSCNNPEPILTDDFINVDNMSNNDNWFEYTAQQDGILTISTCHIEEVDTRILIYEDDCSAPLIDNEDACGDQAEIWYEVLSGETYNIKFDGLLHGLDTVYTADVEVIDNVPGVWFSNPISIQPGIHQVNNSTGDKWYKFRLPAAGVFSVSTKNSITSNTIIQAYYDFDNIAPIFTWDTQFSDGLDSIAYDEGFTDDQVVFVLRADSTSDNYDFEVFFEPMDPSFCDQFDNDSTLNISTSHYQYNFNNQAIFDSGTYTKTVTSIHGCDSLVTLNLTFLGNTCLLPKKVSGDTIVVTENRNGDTDWYEYSVTQNGLLIIDPAYLSDENKAITMYNDCDTEIEPDHTSWTPNGNLITHEVTIGQVFNLKVDVAGGSAADNLLFKVVPVENGLSCTDPLEPTWGTNILDNHLGIRYYSYEFVSSGTLTVSTCGQSNDTYLSIWSECELSERLDDQNCTGSNESYEYTGVAGEVVVFSWDTDYYESAEGIAEFEVSFEAESTCPTTTGITSKGIINVDNSAGDHWFEYTPSQNEVIIVATWGWSSEDTKVSLYDGDCVKPFRTEDDNAGFQTIIQQQLEADVTYYIQFHDEKTSAAYLAMVYFSSEEIPGLTCGQAINIEPGTHTANNLFGDQWYTYTFPTDGEVTISSCGTTTEDTILDFQIDCRATDDSLIDLSDDDCEFQSTLSYTGNAGENIKIVWGAEYEPEELFDFEVFFEATTSCDQLDNDSTLNVSTSRYQYDFNGQAIFDSGTYTKTVTSSHGCDSLVTLNLTFLGVSCLLPKEISGDTIVVTENHNGDTDWYEYSVTQDGLLIIDPAYHSDDFKTIILLTDCDTEISPDHQSWTNGGYLFTHEVIVGQIFKIKLDVLNGSAADNLLFKVVPIEDGLSCDNPLSVALGTNVIDNHLGSRFFSYEFTENGTVTISSCGQANDTVLSPWSTECQWIRSLDGENCPGQNEVYEYTGQIGESILFSWDTDNYLSEEGPAEFEVTFAPDQACTPENINVVESACYQYEFDGNILTESGNYNAIFVDQLGCDSLVTLDLTMLEASSSDLTESVCESYTFNGEELTSSGEYNATFVNAVGCDSLVSLNLTILEATGSTLTESVCESYTFNGEELTSSGEYNATFVNAVGCDSLVSLNLTILEATSSSLTESVCESYTFNGEELTSSGEYNATFVNAAGCDSLVSLNLTILEATSSTLTESVCESYTFNGEELTSSGEYNATFVNAAGCDSLVSLNLTILETTSSSLTESVCESYTFNGEELTSSGEYNATFVNAAGCDSLVSLNLIILEATSSTLTESVCESYMFNGEELTSSGEYNATFVNAAGFDSLVSLNLTILETTSSSLTESVCESYTFNGEELTSSGEYNATFVNAAGCDSLVSLNLTVLEATSSTLTESVCESYTFNGEELTSSGEYNATLVNAAGCDSLVSLNLTILEPIMCEVLGLDLLSDVFVYPNPTKGDLVLNLGTVEKRFSVQIISLAGKVIFFQSFNDLSSMSLKIDDAKGTYLVKVLVEGKGERLFRTIKQ